MKMKRQKITTEIVFAYVWQGQMQNSHISHSLSTGDFPSFSSVMCSEIMLCPI